ncbi:DUF6216 family protein, partial [Xanthomonas campestris pv. campestris]|nr:DUF6216 family protein [Xanthomonas campestris pv. campestris]
KPATTQYPSTPGFISNHWYGRWGQVKVWADPTLKPHLAKEVPKQRHASLFAFAVALWCAWLFYTVCRELISANKLKDLLEERQLGTSQ